MLAREYLMLLVAPVVLELVGLCFAVASDPYLSQRHRRMMFLIIGLIAALIAQNLVGYLLDEDGTHPFARTVTGIFGYSIRPLILLLFFYVVSNRKSHLAAWILVGLNCAVHLTACFSRLCFWIDPSNNFHRGPLGYTCHIISALLLCELVYLTVHEIIRDRKNELWIPLFNTAVIIASVLVDSFVDYRNLPISYLTAAVVNCNLFYYIWLHLQFVRRYEMALMSEQRIQIMMTQIQPHFLYNTLSTIQVLCSVNPEKAAEITGKFSTYLRQNLNTLEFAGLTPFSRELEHTKTYAEIEMIRFPNIRVEYLVEDGDFSLPPLTIQPLVENAIRHGVRIREEGIVRVTARRVNDGHEIVIWDNGMGFDVNAPQKKDGTHVGLKNVRERIEKMCGGSMSVESRIGEGTTVTLLIPEEGGTEKE